MSDQEAYDELSLYTLSLADPAFIHQHIVDAYAAQHANDNSKSIGVYFALMGLYLYLEKNYTGREVQLAHIQAAKTKRNWLKFDLPKDRGNIKILDVLASPAGEARDKMTERWCVSVWEAYKGTHAKVRLSVDADLNLKND